MGAGISRFENLIRDFPEVPGFKFFPTDEQFINPYLLNKNEGIFVMIDPIRTDQDVFRHHPGNLQAHYPLSALENDLFLYTSRVAKYPNIGKREIERARGFWMVSKRSVPIGEGIGHKRVLNFMEGSLKSYTPTNWFMDEYSIKKYNPNQEDNDWIIVRIYQQLTMPVPLTNIVPMTMPLSTMPIPTTFPLTMSMPTPQGMLQPTYVFPSQSPRSQLISAVSLSPDPEIQTWADSHANSGEWPAYYMPLDSGDGDISGSAYPFQPSGSGGTGMDGGRSRFQTLIHPIPAVPGLKFHPTDEQVINFYLQNKIAGIFVMIDPIRTDQDAISRHPDTLQAHYPLLAHENDWYFYASRVAKYPNIGKQEIERARGFWMVSKRSVTIGEGIGHKRVLNFMEGFVKSYTATNWYKEEYSIKKYNPNQEDKDWIIVRIYQQLTMPMPLTNIVPMTMALSTMPIPTTFPLTMSMPTPCVCTIRPQGMLQPTYVFPSQSPRSQLNSAGSLSPDPEIQTWADLHANSGGWSGPACYLPLDSGEGDISGSAYPFQPPGSG